jgi:DNA polymerase phi
LQGSELRDALLGRIFGYAAVVRSGRPLPPDLAAGMVAALVQSAQKKSFLREVAGECMCCVLVVWVG